MDFFQDDSDRVVEDLSRITGHERVLGVRMHACLEYDEHPTTIDRTGDWILDDALDLVWETAAALDTSVFVFPKAAQLSTVAEIADAHPDVQLVVDHMTFPDETTAPDEPPWTEFETVAEHDNVAVKMSSVPWSTEGS